MTVPCLSSTSYRPPTLPDVYGEYFTEPGWVKIRDIPILPTNEKSFWSLFLPIEELALLFMKATNIKLIDKDEMIGFLEMLQIQNL